MRGRLLQNLVLLGLAIGLGLVVFFEPGKALAPVPVLLTELKAESLTQIRIERPHQPAIALVKEDGGWNLRAPVAAPANTRPIESLLKIVAAHSHTRFPVEAKTLEDFALAPPKAKLLLNDMTLLFGDTEALDGHRYIRVGNTIHLITDAYYHHLIATWPSFISLQLLPPGAELVGLELPEFELHREAGRWRLMPEQEAIAADAIEALIQAWQNTQAMRLTALIPGKKVNGFIRLSFSGGQPDLELDLVQGADDLILQRRDLGIQYHLPMAAGRRLLTLSKVEKP